VLRLVGQYGWDPTFVCCDEAARNRLVRECGVAPSAVAVSGLPADAGPQGAAQARDWAAKNVMPLGEWCLWADDNLTSVTGLSAPLSTDRLDFGNRSVDWRAEFGRELSRPGLAWHVRKTVERAEGVGTIFAGFANENNYYFRSRKWQDYGYCCTRLALYKNDGSGWMPWPSCMLEDGCKTIDVVARYGQVVVNRHVKALKPPFEAGGIGSFESRLPWLQDNCRRLAEEYPGLVRPCGDGRQYGMPGAKGFHFEFCRRTPATVRRWREEHGYAAPQHATT
jgi:hypothetical protein